MRNLINTRSLQYDKISLSEERILISKAQKGSAKSKDELLLRHVEFLIFRIYKIAFPDFLKRFRDDLLSEGILLLHSKIADYDLAYCNKKGEPTPVRFRSYIWKRIDGFIIDYLKNEMIYTEYFENYEYHKNLS